MKNKLNEVGASHMLKGSKEFFWHSPKGLCQEANFFHGSGLPPPLQKKGLPPESLCTDRAQWLSKPVCFSLALKSVRVRGECNQQICKTPRCIAVDLQLYKITCIVACIKQKCAPNHWKIEGLLFVGVGVGVQWGNSFAYVTSFKFVAWDFDGSLAHMFPPYLLPNDFLISEVMVQVPSKLVVSKRASKS